MGVKFGRNYVLTVQTQDGGTITVEPPFTVEFDITRNTYSSSNVASIRIFNLSQNHRNMIRKDVTDYNDLRIVQLAAGYGNNLPIIFNGSITQAWSVREGTDFITQIESFDGGFAFANGQTAEAFPAGTAQATVIASLAESLPGVSLGVIGSFLGTLPRGNSYSGNTMSLLKELTGGAVFIDNGKVNCLGNSECLQGDLILINSQNGLLGTPVREQTILNFDMMFEPRLIVGQQVQLDSITGANFNGFYKIISLKHRGTISAAICGDAITSVGLAYGEGILKVVE